MDIIKTSTRNIVAKFSALAYSLLNFTNNILHNPNFFINLGQSIASKFTTENTKNLLYQTCSSISKYYTKLAIFLIGPGWTSTSSLYEINRELDFRNDFRASVIEIDSRIMQSVAYLSWRVFRYVFYPLTLTTVLLILALHQYGLQIHVEF